MKAITLIGFLSAVALLSGCRQQPVPVVPASPAPSATQQAGIFPQPEAAKAIKQHFGFIDVLAYEVRGMWFECWLECEIDGKLAEQSEKLSVGPEQFRRDSINQPLDAASLKGWITLWGAGQDGVELKVRAAYEVPGSSDTYYDMQGPLAFATPKAQELAGPRFSTGTQADADWTGPIAIPAKVGDEFLLQSWNWEESETVDGPKTRSVKITLKARQLAE